MLATTLGLQTTHRRSPLRNEAVAQTPMLRATARLSTGCPQAAEALVSRTLAAAMAEIPAQSPIDRLAARLLAVQRRLIGTAPQPVPGRPARGAGTAVVWVKLEQAMRGLLAIEREVLFLGDGDGDGGGCGADMLADSFGCSTAEIDDLRQAARRELVAQLQRDGSAPTADEVADEPGYASILNIALYQSLLGDEADHAKRQALGEMIAVERGRAASHRQDRAAPEPAAAGQPNRWLRLMYVAYSHPLGD